LSAENGLVVMVVVVVVVVVGGREEVVVVAVGPLIKMLVLNWPPPGRADVVIFSFLLDGLASLKLEELEEEDDDVV
jgi:1,2-phenylacetyl-CoA epoxidase catalytic subunit